MTDSHRRTNAEALWTGLILLASVAFVLALYALGAAYDPLSLWIVGVGAPALTAFVFLYGFTVRWQEMWIGRALMVSSIGTAALIDMALLRRVFPGFPYWDQVFLTVLVFMSMGGFLKLTALLVDKVPLWRGRRSRRRDRD